MKIFYILCVRNPASGLLQIGCKFKKWQWRHNFLPWRHRQFFWRYLVSLVNLCYGPRFMSISSPFMELRQFPFIRYWPEIRNSEITPSEFFPISGDCSELGIPNLTGTSLIKCWNAKKCQRCNFDPFWVIKGKSTGGGGRSEI